MTNGLEQNRINEINRLQGEIEALGGKVKDLSIQALKNARIIGQMLIEQKKSLENSTTWKFPEWVEKNCNFGKSTAYKYIDLFNYRMKMIDAESMQDCYKRIEEIKMIEHKDAEEKADIRVNEFLNTGIKPEGWRQHTDDKLVEQKKAIQEAEKARQERIDQFKAEWDETVARNKKAKTIFEDMTENVFQQAENLIGMTSGATAKMEEWKQTLRLSGDVLSDGFTQALISWLDEMPTDNERLTACHDIIKVVKNIANELQSSIGLRA